MYFIPLDGVNSSETGALVKLLLCTGRHVICFGLQGTSQSFIQCIQLSGGLKTIVIMQLATVPPISFVAHPFTGVHHGSYQAFMLGFSYFKQLRMMTIAERWV